MCVCFSSLIKASSKKTAEYFVLVSQTTCVSFGRVSLIANLMRKTFELNIVLAMVNNMG